MMCAGVIWILCFLTDVLSNQFDPHVYPSVGPFFEGWYLRIIDFESQNSFGLLFGHVLPSTNTSDPTVLASLLLRGNCTTENKCSLNAHTAICAASQLNVTARNKPVVHNPDDITPAQFKWKASFGEFIQNINTTTFQFNFKNYIIRGRIGTPVPWGPFGEGPEGWIDKLPLIPLHWFVYSLRSSLVMYELLDLQTGKRVTGKNGVVHMEKNWGTSFPRGWIWSQGVTNRNISYALSGGLVSVGPVATTQYLFGYRNPSKNISLNFHPGNSLISVSQDGCSGHIKMTARSLFHEVMLRASAELWTYSDCLFGPEVSGFRRACVESYDALVYVDVYERHVFEMKKVDEQTLHLSALEFGGLYTCNNKCKG